MEELNLNKTRIKFYWDKLSIIEKEFLDKVSKIEEEMSKEFGRQLEFFWSDNEIVGIGNEDRTVKLIHRIDEEYYRNIYEIEQDETGLP